MAAVRSVPQPGPAPKRARLRPAGFDELGLRRAFSDRLLPLLVGAMAFLAALAVAGAVAAAALAQHWQGGALLVLTAQVPRPRDIAPDSAAGDTRLARAVAALRATPGVGSVRALDEAELAGLLRPWLGDAGAGGAAAAAALPLPGVIEVRLADASLEPALLASRLQAAAPGATLESHGEWGARLALLARSLQACAGLAVLVVAGVAAAVVAVATRAGLLARRDAIEIVHGLGATDGWVAGQFARRVTGLALIGSIVGTLAALPVLLGLAHLVAPFALADAAAATGMEAAGGITLPALPRALWVVLPLIPPAAALMGWATAQGTVRRWLRRLP